MRKTLLLPLLLSACVDGEELAAVVEPTCTNNYPYLGGSLALPPMKRAAQPAPEAPTVRITEESIEVDYMQVDDIDALRAQLEERRDHLTRIAKYRGEGEVATDRAVLAADANLPAARVAATLTAIHGAGFTELVVLGEPSSKPEMPALPDMELASQLSSAPDPALRAMHMAEAIESAIWLCPDLTMIFEAIGAADPSQKCQLVVAGFREMSAFCVGDQDAIATVMLLMSVPDQYTTFRSLRLAADQPLTRADTWGGILTALPDSATRLGIKPAE